MGNDGARAAASPDLMPFGTEGSVLVYDALIGEDYSYARYADYIGEIFEKHGAPPEPIIADLGCGAGALCVELAKRGFDVVGIDRSPHMLGKARELAVKNGMPGMLFLEQEIDAFELYGSVGAFVSTIDSINYITDKRRLRRLFGLVDNYLSPGGLFIFDVNTEYKLSKVIGDSLFYNITDDLCYIWSSGYDRIKKISASDMTFFTRGRGGAWERSDEAHRQRAYSRGDIETAIAGTGLRLAGVYGFLSHARPGAKAQKANYIIKKLRTGAETYNGKNRQQKIEAAKPCGRDGKRRQFK